MHAGSKEARQRLSHRTPVNTPGPNAFAHTTALVHLRGWPHFMHFISLGEPASALSNHLDFARLYSAAWPIHLVIKSPHRQETSAATTQLSQPSV